MPRGYSQMRKTAYDLYLERDRLPWWFKSIAYLSAWLVFAGYLIFPLVFTSDAHNLKAGRTSLLSIAATLLVLGYVGLVIIAILSKSLLFCFDAVALPLLSSSVVGLTGVVFNHALHYKLPVQDSYIIFPLVLASVSTVGSALFAGFLHYRFNLVKVSDNRRRIRLSREERYSWPGNGDPSSTTELLSHNIPEDELQRQQLLRLLLKRERDRAPSPDNGSTYKIDLPGERQQYLAVPGNSPRPRGVSMPSTTNRFQLSDLFGRNRSPTLDSFKDPRERRREEIERSTVSNASTPRLMEGWPTPPAPYTPGTPGVSPGWGATRYA